MIRVPAAFFLTIFLLASCSESRSTATVYAAGEKATVGSLVYTITDTQVVPRIGDDLGTARLPQNRFYLLHLSVFNSGSAEVPIPGMTLVDDSGKTYNELADGAGVRGWMGISRKANPAQTEAGIIVFDAPAQHYRLRLTDDTDARDVEIDVPLSFVHEQMEDPVPGPEPPPEPRLPDKK